jgi:hypothetical protein
VITNIIVFVWMHAVMQVPMSRLKNAWILLWVWVARARQPPVADGQTDRRAVNKTWATRRCPCASDAAYAPPSADPFAVGARSSCRSSPSDPSHSIPSCKPVREEVHRHRRRHRHRRVCVCMAAGAASCMCAGPDSLIELATRSYSQSYVV